jgi:hypothetical protein
MELRKAITNLRNFVNDGMYMEEENDFAKENNQTLDAIKTVLAAVERRPETIQMYRVVQEDKYAKIQFKTYRETLTIRLKPELVEDLIEDLKTVVGGINKR